VINTDVIGVSLKVMDGNEVKELDVESNVRIISISMPLKSKLNHTHECVYIDKSSHTWKSNGM
jgi:hypothetical protein